MEGETNHAADDRIINAATRGDRIHLFYRDRHHSDFTYFGEVRLRQAVPVEGAPTRFVFDTHRGEAAAKSASRTDEITFGGVQEGHISENEGRKRTIQTVVYERSAKNRLRAIEIHGAVCAACGFDFDEFYGADLARSYIQIHHTRSITEIGDQPVDAKTDLCPLCPNCHCMVHRNPGRILPVAELRAIIEKRRAGR
jgi:5-methylcytosine-specific restriction protein A